jgi:hypothetical protein
LNIFFSKMVKSKRIYYNCVTGVENKVESNVRSKYEYNDEKQVSFSLLLCWFEIKLYTNRQISLRKRNITKCSFQKKRELIANPKYHEQYGGDYQGQSATHGYHGLVHIQYY